MKSVKNDLRKHSVLTKDINEMIAVKSKGFKTV